MESDAKQQQEPGNIVTQVMSELAAVVAEARKAPVARDSFFRYASYLEQLRPILDQMNCTGKVPQLPLRVQTALSGIKAELVKFNNQGGNNMINNNTMIRNGKSKSRLYMLTHCHQMVQDIQNSTRAVGSCLVCFSLSKNASQMREMHMVDVGRKVEVLAHQMQHAHFKVSPSEERICQALQESGRTGSSAAGSEILVEIGHELGLDVERNRGALFEQLQLLRRELQEECPPDPVQLQLLQTMESMFQSWTTHAEPAGTSSSDDPLTPHHTFLCPLTKQVMKDPVFVQSGRTFERSAIKNWFRSLRMEGQALTCPVSGQTLTSGELQPSHALRHSIHEWRQRNVGFRIRQATTRLGPTASRKETENALEDVVLMADESSENRRKLLEAGFISLVIGVWQRNARSRTHHLRSGSLAALRSMATDSHENKLVMVEMGAIQLAVYSLKSGGGVESKEQETALTLLHEFSWSPGLCTCIGAEQGAIAALGAATSSPNEEVCRLAEQTLENLERVDAIALQMATAGRMQPVLTRLCHSRSEATQVELAQHLAQMITSEEAVASTTAGKTLVRMLSISPNAREAALGALFNLSTLEGTADTLVKSGALAHLVFTMLSLPAPTHLKEIAVCTLANLILVNGCCWEHFVVDRDGHFLHSEKILSRFFGLLRDSGSDLWKEKILQVLFSMLCSDQVAGVVAANICSCGGSTTLMTFVTHADTNTRLNAMRLLSLLSIHIGDDIAAAIRSTLQLKYLKELLLLLQHKSKAFLSEEHIAAATILANTPLTEFEVIRVLDVEMLHWTVSTLQDYKTSGQQQRHSRIAVQEALLGILLHFARSSNITILNTLRELQVFTLFQSYLSSSRTPLIKERAARGLGFLSQRCHLFNSTPQRAGISLQALFFGLCVFPAAKETSAGECAVHGSLYCSPNGTFCLVAAQAVEPLIRLVKKDDDDGVREAALGALATLLVDDQDVDRGVEELVRCEGVQPILNLLQPGPGPLQETAVGVIERVLRVRDNSECGAHRIAFDHQRLHHGLVEAARRGGPKTRLLAQSALGSLGSLGRSSSQINARNHNYTRRNSLRSDRCMSAIAEKSSARHFDRVRALQLSI